jgi:hypothetical protein
MIDFLPLVLTGLGLTASIVYYASVLRNANRTQEMQLETRQAQLYMGVYNKFTTRENVDILMELLDWEFDDYDDFQNKYGKESNPEAFSRWIFYVNLFEALGPIVREGYLDVHMIALLMSGGIKALWEKFRSIVMENRVRHNWPRWAVEFEGLYDALIEYSKENPDFELQPNT